MVHNVFFFFETGILGDQTPSIGALLLQPIWILTAPDTFLKWIHDTKNEAGFPQSEKIRESQGKIFPSGKSRGLNIFCQESEKDGEF